MEENIVHTKVWVGKAPVTLHMTHMCQASCVMCHMSHVTCHLHGLAYFLRYVEIFVREKTWQYRLGEKL